jgi:methylglutaconyl-CoA hydratase
MMFRSRGLAQTFLKCRGINQYFGSNTAEKQFRIDYVENGHTALLKMSNAAKKNALSKELLDDMNAAIDELSQNKTVRSAILMSSEPGMFCSGADLKQRLTFTNEQVVETVKNLRRTFQRVYVCSS